MMEVMNSSCFRIQRRREGESEDFNKGLLTLYQKPALGTFEGNRGIPISVHRVQNGLTKVFTDAGLMKYWFPVSNMPQGGNDWPFVSEMVANSHRLILYTSKQSGTEGIAYQWNYMVENQYGNDGMEEGSCSNRGDSLDDKTKSLVLVNCLQTIPIEQFSCEHNSADLVNMLRTCYGAAGNRWANFVAVDYYMRSEGGGSFQAVDILNRELLCGCDDLHACVPGSTSGT